MAPILNEFYRLVSTVVLLRHRNRSYILVMKTIWLGAMLLLAMPFRPSASGQSVKVWIDSLDRPTRKQVVDLGPSSTNFPGSQQLRVTLSCFFYPGFIVKEVYEQQNKAMTSEVIVPVIEGATVDCTQSHVPGEISLGEPDWEGELFVGAKGNLLFFEWADGNDGGRPFSLLDAMSGKQVYADSAYDPAFWDRKPEPSPFNRLRVISDQDGAITLRYLHVDVYECDLHLPTERSACWEKIKVQAGIGNRQIPVCTGYERIKSHVGSAVAYPVEVSLLPHPTRKTIAGPVRCWPPD